jgi:serine protease AprX
MKLFPFLLILSFIQISYAQEKYIIYFTDKGIDSKQLSKNSAEFIDAQSLLSERSIERRRKLMGDDYITIEDIPVKREYLDILNSNGIDVINVLNWFNAASVYLTESQMNLLSSYKFIRNIEKVRVLRHIKPEVNDVIYKQSDLNPALYGNSYTQLNLSDIPQVHSKGIKGTGVLLGVLDTGFKWKTHEALSAADVLAEYDFINNDLNTENEAGDNINQHNHGTSVFSVIAGYKDSVIIGAAYQAEFLLAKTEDVRSETRVEEDNYAAALQWMENFGVDITTSSLGYSEFDNFSYDYEDMNGRTAIVTKAAELAFQRGVLTITSAGNEGNTPWNYITAPADGINTIAVGAVDSQNRLAGFSSKGPTSDGRIKPDITAMGVSVYVASATGDNTYGSSSGTSLAAPVASGAAVLLLSAHQHLNNLQLRDIIIRTADSYRNADNFRGYGLISALKAIEYPNLKKEQNVFTINKRFIRDDVSEAKLYISTNNKNFSEVILSGDTINFTYRLPQLGSGQLVSFYYKYLSSSGDSVRIPSSDIYRFSYDDLIIREEKPAPEDYTLSNNYPNPFNNSTRINFILKEASDAELIIYDMLGQRVKTLFSASQISGAYSILWDGRGDNGVHCASGVYIYRLRINSDEFSKKMVLLK